jgi:hypothetical protein
MYKIDEDLKKALETSLAAGISEEAMKGYRKELENLTCKIEEDLMWMLKDNLAHNLTAHIADMAERAVTSMLEGNDDQMRRYLSCDKRGEDGQYIGWTGRSDGYGTRRDDEWHPVIHGKLFEQGAVALRKQVAAANETLIRDERIRDLEDQVKSLVAQLNKANAEKEEMWQRVRGAA